MTVQQATLANDSCGAYGGPTTVGGTSSDVSERQLLPVHDHGDRQRRQRHDPADDGQGRHDRSGRADDLVQRHLGRQHVRERDDALLPAVGRRHVHGERERRVRPRDRDPAGQRGLHVLLAPRLPDRGPDRQPCRRHLRRLEHGRRRLLGRRERTTQASPRPRPPSPSPPTAAAPTGGALDQPVLRRAHRLGHGDAFTDARSGIASNALTRSDPQARDGGVCPAPATPARTRSRSRTTRSRPTAVLRVHAHRHRQRRQRRDLPDDRPRRHDRPDRRLDRLRRRPLEPQRVRSTGLAAPTPSPASRHRRVERATASLTGSTCGSFGSFTTILASATVSPIVDTSVSAGNCYAYQIVVTNNAGVVVDLLVANVAKLTNASPIQLAPATRPARSSGHDALARPGRGEPAVQAPADGVGRTASLGDVARQGRRASRARRRPTRRRRTRRSTPAPTRGTAPPSTTRSSVTRDPSAHRRHAHVRSDLNDPTGSINYTNGTYAEPFRPHHDVGERRRVRRRQHPGERSEAPLTGATCGSLVGVRAGDAERRRQRHDASPTTRATATSSSSPTTSATATRPHRRASPRSRTSRRRRS